MAGSKAKTNKYALACSILASMTSILLGYDIGVMSGAIIYIQKDLKITDVQTEVVMGILNLYSLIGSAAAGRTSDWIGRRYTIVFAGVIFFAGALLMGFATNYAFLMAGRFVAGVGVGFAMMIAPVYAAEVSPPASRGLFTSLPEVFINIGILLGYEASTRLIEIKEAAGIPESSHDDVVPVPKRNHGEGVWRELLISPTPAVRHILLCAIGIHFFQQASGIDSVVLYSPVIFEKAGIKSDSDKLLATVAVGFTKTIFILVATFLLDRVGRRPMVLSSMGGMIVSIMCLATGLTVIDHADHKIMWAIALCTASIMFYVAFFSIGMGADCLGVQFGDIPVEASGARVQHGGGVEPVH
ncbi:hypothetical protein ABFS83_02G025100 [Erythranthe nasuta]